jgi:hypothetical protein
VFYSSVWQLFYPLILRKSQRQHEDDEFFQMLEEAKFGRITAATWAKFEEKAANYDSNQSSLDLLLTTTHIVGHSKV